MTRALVSILSPPKVKVSALVLQMSGHGKPHYAQAGEGDAPHGSSPLLNRAKMRRDAHEVEQHMNISQS